MFTPPQLVQSPFTPYMSPTAVPGGLANNPNNPNNNPIYGDPSSSVSNTFPTTPTTPPAPTTGSTLGPVTPGMPNISTALGSGTNTFSNFSSPTFVQDLVSSYGNQAGVNPSVKNDPNYWINAIKANGGITNASQRDYWVQRFMTPEGAPVGGPSGTPPAAAPNAGAYVPGKGVNGMGTVLGADNPNQAAITNLEQFLLGELGPNSNNPAFSTDPNSPILKAQVDAFRAEQQRGARDIMAQTAEKAGPNANVATDFRATGEKAAQNTAGFESTLMQQQLTSRQNEIETVLSQYGNMLDAQTQQALQEELSQLQLAQGAYQYDTTRQDTLAGF